MKKLGLIGFAPYIGAMIMNLGVKSPGMLSKSSIYYEVHSGNSYIHILSCHYIYIYIYIYIGKAESLHDELKTRIDLKHPNILLWKELVLSPKNDIIVITELITGGSLRKWTIYP